MQQWPHRIPTLILVSLCACSSWAQGGKPCREFERAAFQSSDSLALLSTFGKNKQLLPGYELQTLIALSFFPELEKIRVKFVQKHTRSPLNTRPVFPQLLKKGSGRSFLVTVSDSSITQLEPILLEKMDFNAQIGVLGHELSHVADFISRSLGSLIGSGINHISSRYIDRFEYRTDSICIAHGLGFQLLAWSRFVRTSLHSNNYEGSDNIDLPFMDHERYMNPSTIEKRIALNPLYSRADSCCCSPVP
jgi:hypothetical protein